MDDRLEQLRPDLLKMTEEELREFVRQTRIDRRIKKDRPAKKVAAKRESVKAKDKASKMLQGMSPEMIAAMLKKLQGK